MSRKDYLLIMEALVKAFHDVPDGEGMVYQHLGVERCVEVLAQAFQADNPRFDYDRFVDFWNKRVGA